MPRTKTVTSEMLNKLLDEFRLENPGMKIAIPNFGKYIRSKGYDIEDHTLRRRNEFRKYLSQVNMQTDETVYTDLVTYKALDIEAFLMKNNSREKMKMALANRDKYFANIAANAVEAINKKKALEKENEDLKARLVQIEKEKTSRCDKTYREELKKKDHIIAVLKGILDDYIYPDAANALLEKEGILDAFQKVIPEELLEQKMIHPDTDIHQSRFASVNKLLGGMND